MLYIAVAVLSLVVQPHAGVRNVNVRTSMPEMIFGIGSKAAPVLTGKGMVVPTAAAHAVTSAHCTEWHANAAGAGCRVAHTSIRRRVSRKGTLLRRSSALWHSVGPRFGTFLAMAAAMSRFVEPQRVGPRRQRRQIQKSAFCCVGRHNRWQKWGHVGRRVSPRAACRTIRTYN